MIRCLQCVQVHVVALPNGDLLLAYDDDANLRTPLALAMSRDGGATWHQVRRPAQSGKGAGLGCRQQPELAHEQDQRSSQDWIRTKPRPGHA